MNVSNIAYPHTTSSASCQPPRYKRGDGCYGEIIGTYHSGVYIALDNNQSAFAYGFHTLPLHSKVLCTVLKISNDKKKTLASIDAIVRYGTVAA